MTIKSKDMTIWIVEPHDPLIVRDGRPFGPTPGARATSLSFPFPSTTTGGVRTQAGLPTGIFDIKDRNLRNEQLKTLKQLEVRGPLLVQLTPDGNDIAENQWLVPAPLDVVLLPPKQQSSSKEKEARLQQLVPHTFPGALTDFDKEELMLVGMIEQDSSKPLKNAPRYWYWEVFQDWLLNPANYAATARSLSKLGQSGPYIEQRMHVSIDAEKFVAKEGMLFQTSGLEFTAPGKDEKRLAHAQRLALAVAVDNKFQFSIKNDGLTSFGGERRVVSWRRSNAKLPSCPDKLEQAIVDAQACRVFLLTPACFKEGYRPDWILTNRHGITPQLKAIATQRPQVVSGWDLDIKKPKFTRRLASAGTVLFLSFENSSPQSIKDWIEGTWMQCISDKSQDRTDGFGLAVLGTWSREPA